MSEKKDINEFDRMVKSVLEQAEEAVPERVWDGISAELDIAARRRMAAVWFRRVAVTLAAAAVVVLVVIFNFDKASENATAVEAEDMIAVIEAGGEEPEEPVEKEIPVKRTLIALNNAVPQREEAQKEEVPANADEYIEEVSTVPEVQEAKEAAASENADFEILEGGYFPEDWASEEVKREKRKVELVLSGLASQGIPGKPHIGPFKRPLGQTAASTTGVEEISPQNSFSIPLSLGIGAKFHLSGRWSIGAGINYTHLSRSFSGKYTNVSPGGVVEELTYSKIKNTQHYIGIPVNVYFDIISGRIVNVYTYAGGTVEKCLSNAFEVISSGTVHRETAKGVQFSVDFGFGLEFLLGRHLGLYIDPSLRYYFSNGQPKSIRTFQPLSIGAEVGLRIKL